MESHEIALLTQTLAALVADPGNVGLRTALRQFGWHELLADSPEVAVSVVARVQGEFLTTDTLLDDVLVAAAGLATEEVTAVVLPAATHSRPTSAVGSSSHGGERLLVSGVVSQAGPRPRRVLVPALRDGALVLVLIDAWTGAWPEGPTGLALDGGWGRVEDDVALGECTIMDGEDADSRWTLMAAAGLRALSHELCGVGGVMLRMTTDHVTTRRQFGHALAEFQAVKHKLADVRVAQEVAELAAFAAWEDGELTSAVLAKTTACRFLRVAREHCQQLLGGMGFSWEHDFHRYLRRALLLEPVLGSAATLRAQLGRDLKITGKLPVLAQL
jgi:hypothetical protein